MLTKQFAATLLAAFLTAGAAGAAVAVNVTTGTDERPTPAGQLAAVEQSTSTTGVPPVPSTIVIDVTVPDLPPVGPAEVVGAAPPGPETGEMEAGGGSAPSMGGDPWSGGGTTSASSGAATLVDEPVAPAPPPPLRWEDDDRDDDAGEFEDEDEEQYDDEGRDDDD